MHMGIPHVYGMCTTGRYAHGTLARAPRARLHVCIRLTRACVWHGRATAKALYARNFEAQPQFTTPSFASVDTEFLLVDVCLFAQVTRMARSSMHPVHAYARASG